MFAVLYPFSFVLTIIAVSAFLGTIIYLAVSNRNMKKEFHRDRYH